MKKGVIISVCAILIAAIGITLWLILPVSVELPQGVLARVNGVSITAEQVENTLKFSQIQMESLYNVLIQSTGSEEKTEEFLNGVRDNFPVTESEVLTRLIHGKVVCQQLDKQGKLISQEEAIKLFNEEYGRQLEDSHYAALLQILESRQTTLEEYMTLGREQSYVFYNLQFAKQNFASGDEYDKTDAKTLDQQFHEYLNKLVEKAQVERVPEE